MKIHFNGAAQTVTGSQHLLEINGKNCFWNVAFIRGVVKIFTAATALFILTRPKSMRSFYPMLISITAAIFPT